MFYRLVRCGTPISQSDVSVYFNADPSCHISLPLRRDEIQSVNDEDIRANPLPGKRIRRVKLVKVEDADYLVQRGFSMYLQILYYSCTAEFKAHRKLSSLIVLAPRQFLTQKLFNFHGKAHREVVRLQGIEIEGFTCRQQTRIYSQLVNRDSHVVTRGLHGAVVQAQEVTSAYQALRSHNEPLMKTALA